MVDPQEAFEILAKHFATVTPEQFKENVRRATPPTPQGKELEETLAWYKFLSRLPPEESESPDREIK